MEKLPTIRRLPTYLHILREMLRNEREFVSSSHLGTMMGIDAILVRKDLEISGISGTPRVGYRIRDLIAAIEGILGWDRTRDAFLVGVGNLGSSLLGYRGLPNYGINVVAAFDVCRDRIGQTVHGVRVYNLKKLPVIVKQTSVKLAILTTPPEEAQQVTDALVLHGIQGIWNFSSTRLKVPPGVITHKEDIFSGLAVLSAKLVRNTLVAHEEGTGEG